MNRWVDSGNRYAPRMASLDSVSTVGLTGHGWGESGRWDEPEPRNSGVGIRIKQHVRLGFV